MEQSERAGRSRTQVVQTTLAQELGDEHQVIGSAEVRHTVECMRSLPSDHHLLRLTLWVGAQPGVHYTCSATNPAAYLADFARVSLLHLMGVRVVTTTDSFLYRFDATDSYDFRCLVRPLGLWYDLWHGNRFHHLTHEASVVSSLCYSRLLWELRCARPCEQLSREAREELVRLHPEKRAKAHHLLLLDELHVRLFMSLFAPELDDLRRLCLALPLELRVLIASHYVFLFTLDARWPARC